MTYNNKKTEHELSDTVIELALKHVIFDGWSDEIINRICSEAKLNKEKIWRLFPRGSLDIAIAFHKRDDSRFEEKFLESDFNDSSLRVRDRICEAINLRLEIASTNKEAVKRSLALFSTPMYFSEGSRIMWHTSDLMWGLVGDQSKDFNWYSKRFTLSSVLMSSLIIWIDDHSLDSIETRGFISRRIENIMTLEKYKANAKKMPLVGNILKKFEEIPISSSNWKESFPGWQFKK